MFNVVFSFIRNYSNVLLYLLIVSITVCIFSNISLDLNMVVVLVDQIKKTTIEFIFLKL